MTETASPEYQKHLEISSLRQKYRKAAGRIYDVDVNPHAHVMPMEDGAFVEIVVWIPKILAQKET
jgi:hypothetical protein